MAMVFSLVAVALVPIAKALSLRLGKGTSSKGVIAAGVGKHAKRNGHIACGIGKAANGNGVVA